MFKTKICAGRTMDSVLIALATFQLGLIFFLSAPASAQNTNSVPCPNPRPTTLSAAEWYACSHDDLNEARNKMTVASIKALCGANMDRGCVDGEIKKINNLLSNSVYRYPDLQKVQSDLTNLTSVCAGNPTQACFQANLQGWSTVDADMQKAGAQTPSSSKLGEVKAPDPYAQKDAEISRLGQKLAALNTQHTNDHATILNLQEQLKKLQNSASRACGESTSPQVATEFTQKIGESVNDIGNALNPNSGHAGSFFSDPSGGDSETGGFPR
jgi:hypothetical protein